MTIHDTIAERHKVHGDYTETAQVAQGLKDILTTATSYDYISNIQRESLCMIATKLARIVCGDPNHADHWEDIIGYATLAKVSIKPEIPEIVKTALTTAAMDAVKTELEKAPYINASQH